MVDLCAVSEDWPFIKIPSEPGLFNGCTIPIKMVVAIADLAPAGCSIRTVGGHVMNLHGTTRDELTKMMEDALAEQGSRARVR